SASLAAAAVRLRDSTANFSSRTAKFRTASFNASSSANVSLTPGLLTIAPNLFQQFVELVNNEDGFIHPGEQLLEVAMFELHAFLVTPVILRLLPLQGQFPG